MPSDGGVVVAVQARVSRCLTCVCKISCALMSWRPQAARLGASLPHAPRRSSGLISHALACSDMWGLPTAMFAADGGVRASLWEIC